MLRSHLTRKQFSLATLFCVVTLVVVVSAGYGIRQRAIAAEDRAMRKIASKGGSVQVWDEGVTIRFDSQASRVFDCSLAAWGRKYPPSGSGVDFRDADLELINKVRSVQRVDLRNTGVSVEAVGRFRLDCPNYAVEF